MSSFIWDTGPLSLYFADHLECKKYMDLSQSNVGYVPNLVLTEFLYLQWRQFGSKIAKYRLESILQSRLITIASTHETIIIAGEYKVKYPQLSIVDATLIALSKEKKCKIITTEFYLSDIKKVKSIKITY